MRVNVYKVVTEAVERGTLYGVRRYYKHRDDEPDEPEILEMAATIAEHVVNEICEWFTFQEPSVEDALERIKNEVQDLHADLVNKRLDARIEAERDAAAFAPLGTYLRATPRDESE